MAIAGLFVGGKARRMGGVAKGLLAAPSGETIVARWRSLLSSLGVEVVLVGAHPSYEALAMPTLIDDPAGIGPLGGLAALLAHAGGGEPAVAVACDMPFVTPALLARLYHHAKAAAVVAPKRDGRWEPLFARYDAARVLPVVRRRIARGEHSLQGLLDEVGATALALAPGESRLLDDWDAPGDVQTRR